MSTTVRPPREDSHLSLDLSPFPTGRESPPSVRRRPRVPRRLLGLLLGMGAVGAVAYFGLTPVWSARDANDRPISVAVQRGTLRIIVTERGNLESRVTVDGVCELTGMQNKIIQLVPEGNKVEKGDVVVRFDSAEIEKNIAQQDIKAKQALSKIETSKQEVEIAKNKGESEETEAHVEFELAELDLEKYQKGDYVYEVDDLLAAIGLSTKDLEEAKNRRESFEALVKKGFKSPDQLRPVVQEYERQKMLLSRDHRKLMVKKNYEYRRKTTEYAAKVDSSSKKKQRAKATAIAQVAKANSEYEAAKATHTIEEQQLKTYLSQKDKAVLKAAQAGIVAYANDRWYDPSSQVREGAMVYARQKIFSLPDMTSMQVKVNVHESLVKKIKPGQMAEIRVDAFPNLVLIGKVKTVSQLADSNRGYMSGGVKEYSTVVTVEKMPQEDLKPGMTAEVQIKAGELSNVLIVPVQAVTEHKGDFFAYVDRPPVIERRKVKVGDTNEKMVHVLDGLKEGERVTLDARSRAVAEFKDDESSETTDKPKADPKEEAPKSPR